MTTYALRLESGTDTAARVRMADLLTLPVGAAPLTSRSALRADGGGAVTVVNGTMTVSVAPFIAWVQGGVSVTQGGYPFVHDAALTLAIDPGHASLARVDVIAGVVRDNAFDASGQVLAAVQVVKGTPGSGTPALPTNSVALREINIPAGTSAGGGGLTASNLGPDRRTYIPAVAEETSWQTPSLAANWQLNGVGYTQPRYRKRGNEVSIEGTLFRVNSASGPSSTMWTMPVGYRPIAPQVAPGDSGGAYVQLNVTTAGVFYVAQSIAVGGAVSIAARYWID